MKSKFGPQDAYFAPPPWGRGTGHRAGQFGAQPRRVVHWLRITARDAIVGDVASSLLEAVNDPPPLQRHFPRQAVAARAECHGNPYVGRPSVGAAACASTGCCDGHIWTSTRGADTSGSNTAMNQ